MLKKHERALKGKTVKEFKTNKYGDRIVITFTDGSEVRIRGGSASIHNDRWVTVEATYVDMKV